jgi:hypothetical protein
MNLYEAIKQSQTASTYIIKRINWNDRWLEIPIISEYLIYEIEVIESDNDNLVCKDIYNLRLEDALADDWIVMN